MFVNDFIMQMSIKATKICVIEGPMGSGKTAFAFRVAYDLLASGYCKYLVSNISNVWQSKIDDIQMDDLGRLNTVIIMDEGGCSLRNGMKRSDFRWD